MTPPPAWKAILKQNFRQWRQLSEFLELSPEQQRTINPCREFPLSLPLRLANKMAKRTLTDPLLLQFLPTRHEKNLTADFSEIPTQEHLFRKERRLLVKYKGRALLLTTSACAMHCRYCFRRHFDFADTDMSFARELEAVAADPSIHEVILSGGDPLLLDNAVLAKIFSACSAIAHVSKVRIHTRAPIGIPERVDAQLLDLLRDMRPQPFFVVHCNHPKELDDDVLNALKLVRQTGTPLLNQSVLLKGVNDDADTLRRLCLLMADNGIIPYYLHQLDRVAGAAHFSVTEKAGRLLMQNLLETLPGYAIPRYVKEIPHRPGKTPL